MNIQEEKQYTLEFALKEDPNFKKRTTLRQRLLSVYKKLGLEYNKEDFIRAGLRVTPHWKYNRETGFIVYLPRGNAINYVLIGLPDISPSDNPEFFGLDPACVGKDEDYLEEWRGISIYLPSTHDGFTSLIQGEFTDIVTKKIKFQPRLVDIDPKELYTDRGRKLVSELEELCKKVDANRESLLLIAEQVNHDKVNY